MDLLEHLLKLHKVTEGNFVVGGSAAVLLYVLSNNGNSEDLKGVVDQNSDIDIYLNRNFPVGIQFISDITGNPPMLKNGSHGTVKTEEFGKIDYFFSKNLSRTEVYVGGIKFHVLSIDSLIKKYEFYKRNANYNKIKILKKLKNEEHKYNITKNMLTMGNMPPPMNLDNGFTLGGGGFVKIRGHGRRKIRYYKNGNPYVIVGGKKKRLS